MNKVEREALAARVLAASPASGTEVTVSSEDRSLTRFTHNAIHQNVAAAQTILRVRAVVDGRVGVASGDDLSAAGIERTLAHACEVAAVVPADPDAAPLVRSPEASAAGGAFVDATAHASPSLRAGLAAHVFDCMRANELWAAGYVATASAGITLANSAGTIQSFDGTDAGLNVKANGEDASGFAERYSADVRELDAAGRASIAATKATQSAHPVAVDPGEWTVILEPPAFGELLEYLAEHFSAQAFNEGSSFLSDGLDRPYVGENVTIYDDHAHPLNIGMPFDFEGTPTARVPLISRGNGVGIVTDARWSALLQRPNTGHALPAPSADGPQARHLVVEPGSASLEELIADTPRGLLVSRFWYIRTVDRRATIVTGMTRDGTFLIERGKIVGGVRNLRFNQSILEALRAAEFSRELVRTGGYSYASVVPAARIRNFAFTSTTAF